MKSRLLLALHFHQPVGNFDAVFEKAVHTCYAPLVEHFERHPGVRAAFHLSGCLLEWLEAHDAGLLDRVFSLVGRGQIEPLGGGFYEPILTVISRVDALDQLERLSEYWRRHCGLRPRGVWLAERVWEQGLCELLAEAGVQYTVLDDQHLRFAGLLDERFSGLFVTERNGKPLGFFPSDFQARYLIPFRTIEMVREHFEHLNKEGRGVTLTYGDDAEKFGLWPGTHEWVYGKKWLEEFFTLLEDADSPLLGMSPGDYLKENPPARKVYLPNSSYTEMLEWALPAGSSAQYRQVRGAALGGAPAESVRAFVRGSLWDAFLMRYPEADQLHKHALWTARNARALPAQSASRQEALTFALRGQCNCAYWHGLFGGVYLPHLRHGVYENLLAADALLALERNAPTMEAFDLDGDLRDEVVLKNASMQAFFKPSDAGTLVELDCLLARFNVTNVVSRWREAYHEGSDIVHTLDEASANPVASPHELSVEIGKEDLQGRYFDEIPLRSLRDFLAARPPTPEDLASFSGMTLAQGEVRQWALRNDGWESTHQVENFCYRRRHALNGKNALEVQWNQMEGVSEGVFGTLLCLTLLAPDGQGQFLRAICENGEELRCAMGARRQFPKVRSFEIAGGLFGFLMRISLAVPADLTLAPLETLQRSEEGYEAVYQGTVVSLAWRLPAGDKTPGLVLTFESLQKDGSPLS